MAGVPAARLSIEIVAEIARLQRDLDAAKAAVKAASGDIGNSVRAANDNLGKLGDGLTRSGQTGKLAGHHMQNLAFQFQDLGVQMAMAAQSEHGLRMALMALFQQGTQISAIMSQAGIGIRGLGDAALGMAGRFAPALAAAAAGALAFQALTAQINENSKVHVTWQDTALGTYDAIVAAIKGALTAAFKALGIDVADVFETIWLASKQAANLTIGAFLAAPKMIITAWQHFPAALGEMFYGGVNLAIQAVNALVRASVVPINALIATANSIGAKFGLDALPTITAPQISALGNQYAGAFRKMFSAVGQAAGESFGTDYFAAVAEWISPFAQARARERLAGDAGKAGKEAGQRAGKAMKDEWAKLIEEIVKDADDALRRASLELNTLFDADRLRAYDDVIAAANDNLDRMQQPILDAAKAAEFAGLQQQYWNDQLRETIDHLDKLGGLGSTLADIGAIGLGLKSGDFSGVRGQLGGVLNLVSQSDSGKKFLEGFGSKLDDIFGGAGKFTTALSGALNTVGIGLGTAAIVGNGSKGSQIGGAVGAAIGSVIPGIGTVIGSIVGSIFGGLFSKAKTGSASVTAGGIVSGGNNADARSNTGSIGGAVQSSLAKIAAALGGTVGSFGVTIGQRKDEFRVAGVAGADVTSKNPANLLYRGNSADEALRAALKAVVDSINGIRQGAANLLKLGSDIEAQVDKAIKFNAVFDELARRTDEAAFNAAQLARSQGELSAIFAEASAGVEDLAALEKLFALQRKELADDTAAKELEKLNAQRQLEVRLMATLGNAAGALALTRAIELSEAREEQRATLAQIHAAEDLNTRRALEIDLLETMGKTAEAAAARRQQEMAALDESLRPLLAAKYAWLDAGEAVAAASERVESAKAALTAAYGRESAAMEAMGSKWRGITDNLRTFMDSLSPAATGGSFAQSLIDYLRVSGGAIAGSESDAGAFEATAKTYLASSLANARTALDYQREVARVRTDLGAAINTAGGRASGADQQLAALRESVAKLITLDENTLSVADAIKALDAAQAEAAAANLAQSELANPVPQLELLNSASADMAGQLGSIAGELARSREDMAAQRRAFDEALAEIRASTRSAANTLSRWDDGGAAKITNDSGEALLVVQN